MANELAKSLPLTKPRVPESLLACLATPDNRSPLDWEPPAQRPPAAVLRQTLGDLRVHLQPATQRQIAEELMRLQSLTRSKEATGQDWAARGAEYSRLMGHYPADIWHDAVDDWLRNPKAGMWFPTIAELGDLMARRFVERKQMIQRIEYMLQPQDAKDDRPKEPRHVRLKAIRDAMKDSKFFHQRAVNAEIELAEIEGREPEAWATAASS